MRARYVVVALAALALGACTGSPNPSPTLPTGFTARPSVTYTGTPSPIITETVTVSPEPDVVTRTRAITVTVTHTLSPTSAPSFTAEPKYTSPEEMRDILVPAMSLDHCTNVARDFFGTLYTECLTPSGEIVRMSAWDEPRLDNADELKALGWQVYGEEGWSVAANTSPKVLEEAVTLLLQARGDH